MFGRTMSKQVGGKNEKNIDGGRTFDSFRGNCYFRRNEICFFGREKEQFFC